MAKKKMVSEDDAAAMSTSTSKTRRKKVKEEEAEIEEDGSIEVNVEPITFVPVIEADESATSVLEEAAKRPTRKRTRGKPPPELLEEERRASETMAVREEDQYGFGSAVTDEGVEMEPMAATKGFGIKPGSIVSQEVIDILETIEPPPESERPIHLPPELQPVDVFESFWADAHVDRLYWERRKFETKAMVERALKHHAHQNFHAVNRYATTRRVSRLMAEVEEWDFARGEASPQHIPPWARAEVVFESEFDEFNNYIRENIDDMFKRLPKEAEEEELDILDDALFLLSREDDDNALNKRIDQQDHERSLASTYLDNILPGLSLSSLSEAYADDIFDDDEENADQAADADGDLAVPVDASLGEEEAPKPKRSKGRPKKIAASQDEDEEV